MQGENEDGIRAYLIDENLCYINIINKSHYPIELNQYLDEYYYELNDGKNYRKEFYYYIEEQPFDLNPDQSVNVYLSSLKSDQAINEYNEFMKQFQKVKSFLIVINNKETKILLKPVEDKPK